jgi:hypothetical protein
MTSFEDRGRAAETAFTREAEMTFRITARRNRLLGQWAAARMGLTPAETDSYATGVVQSDFENGDEDDVARKLLGDLTAAGIDTDEAEIQRAMAEQAIEARRQLMEAR